jgi:uncharacterized protein YndB with AHSA1/START domain
MAEPVRAEIVIDAPPERVFPYFTEPERMARWLGTAAQLEPRPGGQFAVEVGDVAVRGSYEELEPPRRIVFTWGVPGWQSMAPGTTRVEVTLEPTGRGGTRVALTHHDLPDRDMRERHSQGWNQRLAALAAIKHLAEHSHTPRPDDHPRRPSS